MKLKQIAAIGVMGLASLGLFGCDSETVEKVHGIQIPENTIRISRPVFREWKNYDHDDLSFQVIAYDPDGIESIKYYINDDEVKAGLFARGGYENFDRSF